MTGKEIRLRRLFRHNSKRLLIVPLDHSVSDGPIDDNPGFAETISRIAEYGTDAVVVHKGRMRHLSDDVFMKTSVIVHLSASTRYSTDSSAKYLVADVESAIMRGADGVSVHVNLGSGTEGTQLRDMAIVADSCERFGIPLLAMMYTRDSGVEGYPLREALAHAGSLAADFGADIVKLALPGGEEDAQWITSRTPLPIVAAGGEKVKESKFLEYVEGVLTGGAIGLASGRNIFRSNNISSFIKRIRLKMDNRRMGSSFSSRGDFGSARNFLNKYNDPV